MNTVLIFYELLHLSSLSQSGHGHSARAAGQPDAETEGSLPRGGGEAGLQAAAG